MKIKCWNSRVILRVHFLFCFVSAQLSILGKNFIYKETLNLNIE